MSGQYWIITRGSYDAYRVVGIIQGSEDDARNIVLELDTPAV